MRNMMDFVFYLSHPVVLFEDCEPNPSPEVKGLKIHVRVPKMFTSLCGGRHDEDLSVLRLMLGKCHVTLQNRCCNYYP